MPFRPGRIGNPSYKKDPKPETVDGVAESLVGLTFEGRQVVIAVQMDLPGLAVGLVAFLDFLDDVGHAATPVVTAR
jgi:hypothetical protein